MLENSQNVNEKLKIMKGLGEIFGTYFSITSAAPKLTHFRKAARLSLSSKNNEDLHIEVIGYKKTGPARAKDFYEIFFRAVSRLNNGAQNCVIALPKQFGVGLPARAGQHRVAWERIGEAFPELEIWLVDVDKGSYKKTSWVYWLGK
ncbi:MAG: hypothetical protein IH840_10605 [Candidatus Heimdallarchaeota archaeon]|nr:hypothetical protein [Candidatus Heimdallarchaeota archaeon]